MTTIDINIALHSIDSVLSAEERETFRGYVAERVSAAFDCDSVSVNVTSTDSTRAHLDGVRSYEIEREVQDAFDAFCSE